MINSGRFPLIVIALLLVLPLLAPGCGRDDRQAPAPGESGEVEAAFEEDEEYEEYDEEEDEDFEQAADDFDAPSPGLPSFTGIETVSVETLTGNPRDGFKAAIVLSGPQNEDVGYIYDWTINGREVSGVVEETLSWQEGLKRGDTVGVTVTPYSDLGQGVVSVGGSFVVPNSPPVISSEPAASFLDGKFTYTVLARDPDGDPVDFTLKNAPPGMTIEPATGLIVWEYDAGDEGEYKVTVVAADSEGAQASQELTLSITPDSSAED